MSEWAVQLNNGKVISLGYTTAQIGEEMATDIAKLMYGTSARLVVRNIFQ